MKLVHRFFILTLAVLMCGSLQAQSQESLAHLMQQRDEYYFSLNINNPSEIQVVNSICSVDATNGVSVICYANQAQYDNLLAAGYQPTLLTPPSLRETAQMHDPQRDTYDWDAYLTYPQYVSMMEGFPATAVGDRTCTFIDLGTLSTSNHRKILGVRINNGEPNGKPKFLYTSTMHGDEVTGMILILRLIDELCTSTDSRIVNLVNSLDIFIFPCTNPDGTYYGGNNTVTGARRYNGNGIDLNRHFPDFDDGAHPDGASYYQDEAQWMMDLAQQYLFTMGANYHGGAEVMNYPWDTYQPTHPDDNWWRYICREYAQLAQSVNSSYMTGTSSNGIINGYAWYTITGSRQDYMNYYAQCREVTIECSTAKTPSASQLPNFWNYNHNSMLTLMEQCLNGVHGIITDAVTGQPIEGVMVTVINHDHHGSSVTSHDVGDFHRPIKGGNYTFKFTKEGYCSETVDVTIADDARIDLTVNMSPSGSCPVDCYEEVTPSAPGSYIMGHRDGNTFIMPTHSSGSSTTTSVNLIPNEEGGIAIEQGEINYPFVLTSTGTEGQYYIAYNGYYLTRNSSGYGNRAITWSTSQSSNNRWTISSNGISQTTTGWGGGTTYYLFYNNGTFYTGTSNANNITFYQEGDCPETTYTINVEANPTEGGTVEGGGVYQEGETCTVSTSSNEHYVFENWTENGQVVSSEPNYSFTVNADRSLVAHFAYIPTNYTINVSANPTEGGAVEGGGIYQEGETCTVIASPNEHYAFESWTENEQVVSSVRDYTFPVSSDRNLVANFTYIPQNFTINVSASPTEGGIVEGGGIYQEGQTCTVIASPNEHYTFENWTENGQVVSSVRDYTFTISSDRNLVAHFTYIPQNFTINVSASPTEGGSVSGGGTFQEGSSCTVNATPASGYTFINWTENGSFVSANAQYTFTVNGNRNLVAHFSANPLPLFDISVVANPTQGGIVVGGGTYQQGQPCTVTATANNGYNFLNWTENGNVVSTTLSYNFTVNSDRNLVAHFELKSFTIEATALPEEGGTVYGSGVYHFGETATLRVDANEKYIIQNWTENGATISEEATYSFIVTGNRNLVANLLLIDGNGEQNHTAFTIYPNPVNNVMIIEADESIEHLEIFNLVGVMVYSKKNCGSKVEISTADLPAGTYLVRLTTHGISESSRFVKE